MSENRLITSVEVKLGVTGSFDFINELTSVFEVKATNSHVIGEEYVSVFGDKRKHKNTLWEYRVPIDSLDFDKYLDVLNFLFLKNASAINSFSKINKLDVCLTINCTIRNGQTPGSYFTTEFIHLLSLLGASLNFDIYVESQKYYEPLEGYERLT